jgi:glycosyltransferase involved in cell wall biosynthesis
MKITMLSYDDGKGGAGRAALKLHNEFIKYGVTSKLRVSHKYSDLSSVYGHSNYLQKISTFINDHLSKRLIELQRKNNKNLHSLGFLPLGISKELNKSNSDIIQLNWICGLISIKEISKISKPLVWRLSDMWPFSGAEHYGDDNQSSRWRHGYYSYNKELLHDGIDIDRWVWESKLKYWNKKKIHIIAPSNWIADCARNSRLMRDWPISVVPTAIDTNQFQPWNKEFARKVLKLPLSKKLILFGAMGGGNDERKGFRLLKSALQNLILKMPKVEAVIFGQSEPINKPEIGLPVHWMGHLKDDISLSMLYSAVDVFVLPSKQDNLPQTGIEAQSCGCPVVTFNISGMADLIKHKVTGYMVNAFDVIELAQGIEWVISDVERLNELKINSRDRALQLWAPSVVVPKYLEIYKTEIEKFNK